jgi:hypothetical protein
MGLFLAGSFDIGAQLGQHDLGHAVGACQMGDGETAWDSACTAHLALLVFCHTSPASKAANNPNRIEMAVKYGATRPVLSRMVLDSGPLASARNSSRQKKTGSSAASAICQAEA